MYSSVLIIAGGDISGKLPFLRVPCSCPALIPLNTRPVVFYIIDFYRNHFQDIHLFVDRTFIETVSSELSSYAENVTIHAVEHCDGVVETLAQALKTESLGDDLIINLVTTVPTVLAPERTCLIAKTSHRGSYSWSSIRLKNGAPEFFKKSAQRPEGACDFIGVFRAPKTSISDAVSAIASSNDLLSVVEALPADLDLGFQACEWIDCGHETNYNRSRAALINSRSFNSLRVDEHRGTIVKQSSDHAKLALEAGYSELLPEELKIYYPRLVSRQFSEGLLRRYEMEYYGYPNLAEYLLYWKLGEDSWWRVFESLNAALSRFRERPTSIGSGQYHKFHWLKSIDRIESYLSAIEDPSHRTALRRVPLKINGTTHRSLDTLLSLAETFISKAYREDEFCVFHGDFCFNNILFDVISGVVRFIDPRGSFGEGCPGIYGDRRYDLAKLNHSATGHYDYLVNGLYQINRSATDSFELSVHTRPNSQWLSPMMDWLVDEQQADRREIDVMTALLFLSMCPLHSEDTKRQNAFFLTGIRLLDSSLS